MRRLLRTTGGRERGLLVLALATLATGLTAVVVAVAGQQSAPRVPASAAGTLRVSRSPADGTRAGAGVGSGSGSPAPAAQRVAEPLPASRPVSISIPSIGVHSRVFPLGLAKDGSLAVPQPGPRLNAAAWFENSPTPGQPGPAVIEGHVDSTEGPSVFFELGKVRPGDRIRVRRADGRTVVFTVNAVRDFKKSRFPTTLVYGGTDLSTPQLRLITCSDFDASIGHHVGNEVVFAHLTSVRR